ncbi:hypothetical protein GGI20_000382 [Coemansia sp. BCRC 34301]|nr:hypothetical protein GGI20_000382 [Coemansia sp. BCRC 34301]
MSSLDGSKRQRTDKRHSPSPTPESSKTRLAESGSGADAGAGADADADVGPRSVLTSAVNATEHFVIHKLLERLLAKQERIAADVVRLQSTVDAVLATLRHKTAPQLAALQQQSERSPLSAIPQSTTQTPPSHTWSPTHPISAVPPTLANIVTLRDETSSSLSSTPPTQGASRGLPHKSPLSTSAAESVSPQSLNHQLDTVNSVSNNPANSGSDSRFAFNTNSVHEFQQPRPRNPATSFYSTPPPQSMSLPPLGAVARNAQPGGITPSIRSPPPLLIQGQNRGHQHQPSTPVSVSSAPAVQFSNVRMAYPGHQQQQQRLSGLSLASPSYQQHTKPTLHFAAHQAAESTPKAHQNAKQHSEHPMSLPPIRTTSSAAHPLVAHPRSSISQRTSVASASPYSSSASLAPSMGFDATYAAPKPSSSHQTLLPGISGLARTFPATATGSTAAVVATSTTPTPSMVESPTGSSTGNLGSRSNATPSGSRSYSGSQSGGGGGAMSQQKVEKNRFQANIRAFVDHHFIAQPSAQWDYQQSFKAPRNAQATHHIVQAFYLNYGGTYERIEHGLGVYFSSLKAKHRTTDDKAMLKQQRDRRRARRIKKAAGRRKVFEQSQYPFLPHDFDAQLCFVPSAMSPEHTDEEGEVKVGALPWRTHTFNKLFRHLDTLRPKRTPRPSDPKLSGSILPPPDVPAFMLDMEYMAVDRSYHHDPEEDIEMGSSSDEAGSRSGSAMYM